MLGVGFIPISATLWLLEAMGHLEKSCFPLWVSVVYSAHALRSCCADFHKDSLALCSCGFDTLKAKAT